MVATAVVTVLNHVVRLALKATAVVTVSKVVAIVLKTVVHLHLALKAVLKVAAISALKLASSHAATPAANSAALHLAVVKAALSPAAISALTIVAVTASKPATIATAVHPAIQALQPVVTMHVAAQASALRPVAPKSSEQAISSPTMPADMQHPSALALKC